MCVFALSIVYRIVQVQYVQGDAWREKAKQLTISYENIEASRGNIFDVNGNLLATSLPYYEVGMDVNAPALTKDTFNKYVNPLAEELATMFPDKSKKEFKKIDFDSEKNLLNYESRKKKYKNKKNILAPFE